MIFIRHNSLKPPFNDYTKLSLEQLDALATCSISPDIAELPEDINLSENIINGLEESRLLICSSHIRTKQTCEALLSRYGIKGKEIISDSLVDEILFTPSKMIKDPNENPLLAVRKYLYSSITENNGATETLENLETRINRFIEKYRNSNCVIFSHGFLIRLLISMQNNNGSIIKAIENISDTSPIDYLEANNIDL